MKLFQIRSINSSVNYDTFIYNDSNVLYLNASSIDTSPYMNLTYSQDPIKFDIVFQGMYQDYDYSGYNLSLKISDDSYKKSISDLITVVII